MAFPAYRYQVNVRGSSAQTPMLDISPTIQDAPADGDTLVAIWFASSTTTETITSAVLESGWNFAGAIESPLGGSLGNRRMKIAVAYKTWRTGDPEIVTVFDVTISGNWNLAVRVYSGAAFVFSVLTSHAAGDDPVTGVLEFFGTAEWELIAGAAYPRSTLSGLTLLLPNPPFDRTGPQLGSTGSNNITGATRSGSLEARVLGPYAVSTSTGDEVSASFLVGVTMSDPTVAPSAADARDRLRSGVSETTGSLLDAVDVRAVDASVSEAYTYAQRLEPQTLTSFREVLRERDSATVDLAYYPRPRQNSVMENQYDGVTILSRLSSWYPPRAFGLVDELGITSGSTATAQEVITWVLGQWAALVPWLTYETVPDLRVRMPDLNDPTDYDADQGVARTNVLTIAQEGNDRRDALTILRDLLSPFPGTVVRQNSAGRLEIVPQVGPDADADDAPSLALDTYDLYSVSIGEPDPFDIVNRATFTSRAYERQENVETMHPAWFQIGSLLHFGADVWYTPPNDRVNLQAPTGFTSTILQEDDLTGSSAFTAQTPGLWPVGSDAIPAGDGISLRDASNDPTVTLAWSLYTAGSTTVKESGTDGFSLLEDFIPFDGVWRDTLRWARAGGSGTIQCRWNAARNGVEFRLGAWDLEANCFIAPCDGFVVEFTLNDSSVGFAPGIQRSGTFGVVDDPDTPTASDDFLPGVGGTNAVAASQAEFGLREATVNVTSYAFTNEQLEEMARGFVLANITPKVTRELEVSAFTGFRVLFDDIGRKVSLPNSEVGVLTGVEYSDDFIARTVRKTARVQVPNASGTGAIDTTTARLLNDDNSYMLNDDGTTSEVL